MRLELLGEHVHTAETFLVLGQVHFKMGDFPSAVAAFKKATDTRLKLLGEHVHTALSSVSSPGSRSLQDG